MHDVPLAEAELERHQIRRAERDIRKVLDTAGYQVRMDPQPPGAYQPLVTQPQVQPVYQLQPIPGYQAPTTIPGYQPIPTPGGVTVVVKQPAEWGQQPTYIAYPPGSVPYAGYLPTQPAAEERARDDWACALCGLLFSVIPIVG